MKRMEPKARLKQKSNTNHQYRYDENVTLTTKHGVDTLQKLANESTEDAKSVASHTSFVDWDQNIIADNANNHRIGEDGADDSGRDNDEPDLLRPSPEFLQRIKMLQSLEHQTIRDEKMNGWSASHTIIGKTIWSGRLPP